MTARRIANLAALLSLTACGGVHHVVRDDVPVPRTIAVLPFAGAADATVREGTRALLASRLRTRGYHVVELTWADGVLAANGWLRDPADFDPDPLPLADVIAALRVDAVAIGRDFDESSFNVMILRRHSFGGDVALRATDGRAYWSANHATSVQGGFLLTSGQVFAELRAQGEHGTPMETLALVDEFVTDIVDTVPARSTAPRGDAAPEVTGISHSRTPNADGSERLVVEAHSSPGASLCCDLGPGRAGVPMVALRGEPGRYRGVHDLPAGAATPSIVVRARNPFGLESRQQVTP